MGCCRALWSPCVGAQGLYPFVAATTLRQFWNQNIYPEIAELRAVRFAEFTATQRIIDRLLQPPPASHWPSTLTADQLTGRKNSGRFASYSIAQLDAWM